MRRTLSILLGVFLVLAFAGTAKAVILSYGQLPTNFNNATLDVNVTIGNAITNWNYGTGNWSIEEHKTQLESNPMINQKVGYNTSLNITLTDANMNISKIQYAVQDKRVTNVVAISAGTSYTCTYAETNSQGWKVYNCTTNIITKENKTSVVSIVYNITGIKATWKSENMYGSNQRKAIYNVTYPASRMNITNATLYVVPIFWHTNIHTSHPWTVGSNITDISTGVGYANGYTSNRTGSITYSSLNNSNMSYWLEIIYDVTSESPSHGKESTTIGGVPTVMPVATQTQTLGLIVFVVSIVLVVILCVVLFFFAKGKF